MFATADGIIAAGFAAAAARLARLAQGNGLRQASSDLYDDGVAYLLRVGPAGPVPGASKLVRVMFTEPVRRDGAMAIGLRWEATGAAGKLFPALDADIRLADIGDGGTRLTVTGSYRPPFGTLGAGIDRRILRGVAKATIRQLLRQVAGALEEVPEAVPEAVIEPAAWFAPDAPAPEEGLSRERQARAGQQSPPRLDEGPRPHADGTTITGPVGVAEDGVGDPGGAGPRCAFGVVPAGPRGRTLKDVRVESCRMDMASFRFAKFKSVVFSDCKLMQATSRLRICAVRGARFERCDLTGAQFSKAQISRPGPASRAWCPGSRRSRSQDRGGARRRA